MILDIVFKEVEYILYLTGAALLVGHTVIRALSVMCNSSTPTILGFWQAEYCSYTSCMDAWWKRNLGNLPFCNGCLNDMNITHKLYH